MQKYDIHVCLISEQAAANLLPVLDPEFKPNEAIFLVSKTMKEKAAFLADAFKAQKVKVNLVDLIDEFNFGEMEDQLIDLISQYENSNIALNVTGSTKLISIAAANAFNLVQKPIFYIDTDKNRIVFLSKNEHKEWLPELPLNAQNKIDIYLSAYGAKVINTSNPEQQRELLPSINALIKNYDQYQNIVPLLNKFASISQSNGYKASLDNESKKINKFHDFLFHLDYLDIIDFDGSTINFKNKKVKEFLNGGWLEDYTYNEIKDITHIQDILCNADVANHKYQRNKNEYSPENKGNKNEFDITFIAKNKLHIIECKTLLMDKGAGVKAEDILYKLETLKDYGGLMTKKCLVSYFEVPEQIKNRANYLNIEIIQGKDLLRLKEKVQNWIGKR